MDTVAKVRRALLGAGHQDTIAEFPAGTHSAADAAAAVGCSIAQIAKSIVFRSGEDVVLVIASGVNRIDRRKVAEASGLAVKVADPAWVEARTGFPVGGVSPVGHCCLVTTVVDADLLSHEVLWAAAGSPRHAFRTGPAELLRLTGGRAAEVRQG